MKEKTKVSEVFEAIKKRPLVYFGKLDPQRAICYLHGFYDGYDAASTAKPNLAEARNKILSLRGWQVPSVLIDKEMERRGFTVEEIINELLDIEIETWRLIEQAEDA